MKILQSLANVSAPLLALLSQPSHPKNISFPKKSKSLQKKYQPIPKNLKPSRKDLNPS